MAAGLSTSNTPEYRYIKGINDGIRQIWRHEGITGLFRGFAPRVCITSLQSAVMFFIYERALARMMHLRPEHTTAPQPREGRVASAWPIKADCNDIR